MSISENRLNVFSVANKKHNFITVRIEMCVGYSNRIIM